MQGTFYYRFFLFTIIFDVSIICAQSRVSVLLVSKRVRPRIGSVDYLIVGRSAHTELWGSFTSPSAHENPEDAAADALIEEIQAPETLGMGPQELAEFVDKNTWYIIDSRAARQQTYVTFVKPRLLKQFKSCFYQMIDYQDLPIDQIAMIRWENIELAFRKDSDQVYAHIANGDNAKEEYRLITLSPEFIKSVKPFFTRKSYEVGENKRVRIY